MTTRAELRREYKERKVEAGIFQIKNLEDGKILLGSSKNLHGPLNKIRFLLGQGMFENAALQADWKALGADAFAFEILEVAKVKDEPGFSLDDELLLLEEIWMEKLKPGYNVGGKIFRD